MMRCVSADIVDITWDKIKNPSVGLYISRHFVERFYERCGDIDLLKVIIHDFRHTVCERIFECSLYGNHQRRDYNKKFKVVYTFCEIKNGLVIETLIDTSKKKR